MINDHAEALETHILLDCVHASLDRDRLPTLAESLRDQTMAWDRLLVRAQEHGIQALLYKLLADSGLESSVPQEAMAGLKRNYCAQMFRQSFLLGALRYILQQAEELGIQCIVLKGAALVQQVYSSVALRPFADIDILVAAQDVPSMQQVLLAEGFERKAHTPDLTRPQEAVDFTYIYTQIAFTKPGPIPIHVEIHCHPIHLGLPSTRCRGLWDRAVVIPNTDFDAYTLHPEDMLLHMCHHLCRHGYSRLIWFVDISLILRCQVQTIDWRSLISAVRPYQACFALYYGLLYTQELLGHQIQPWVLRDLRPKGLTRRVFEHVHPLDSVRRLSCRHYGRLTLRLTLFTVDGILGKLGFLLASVMPRVGWLRARYPDTGSAVLCYLKYLLDVLRQRNLT